MFDLPGVKMLEGHKITSLAVHGDKLLVTSNDSRIRIYDLRDMDLTCKFKGAEINQSQIRASFSPDGKHIICGSEDNYIYIWRATDFSPSLSVRKDRNPMWERIKAHNSIVTAAVFAPKPHLFLSLIEDQQKSQTISVSGSCAETIPSSSKRTVQRMDSENSLNVISTHGALSSVHIPNAIDTITIGSTTTAPILPSSIPATKDRQLQGDIIVSADLNGCIKIFANPSRIKTGSSNFFPTEY
jgi:WD40 repeat protein